MLVTMGIFNVILAVYVPWKPAPMGGSTYHFRAVGLKIWDCCLAAQPSLPAKVDITMKAAKEDDAVNAEPSPSS